LELPEEVVTEFLLGLLGENKRKDIEKGFKYARELEFIVPESVKWAGRTREEWEGRVIAYLNGKRRVNRQELIKSVFHNQKWLCDLIMDGLIKKGMVISEFEVYGRGRPRKVYELAEEMRIPLRKAVGCEEIIQAELELSAAPYNKEKFVVGCGPDFSQNNNSLSFRERAMGGGWKGGQEEREREEEENFGDFSFGLNCGILSGCLSFKSCFGFSVGGVGVGDERDGCDECNELVELWEKGLIDF
jgi:hypothetical protein